MDSLKAARSYWATAGEKLGYSKRKCRILHVRTDREICNIAVVFEKHGKPADHTDGDKKLCEIKEGKWEVSSLRTD